MQQLTFNSVSKVVEKILKTDFSSIFYLFIHIPDYLVYYG